MSGYSGIGKSSVVNELHKALVPPRGLFAVRQVRPVQARHPVRHPGAGLPEPGAPASGRRARRSLAAGGTPCARRWARTASSSSTSFPSWSSSSGTSRRSRTCRRRTRRTASRWFSGGSSACSRGRSIRSRCSSTICNGWMPRRSTCSSTWSPTRKCGTCCWSGPTGTTRSAPRIRSCARSTAIREAGARVAGDRAGASRTRTILSRLVADALHCEPERARPLAQLVHEKTGGNPFFAIQFLTALAEEGLLAFDPVTRGLAMGHRSHPRQGATPTTSWI